MLRNFNIFDFGLLIEVDLNPQSKIINHKLPRAKPAFFIAGRAHDGE
jgi:hypothetical protein